MRGTEGRSLARLFATRDAASIAEALRQTVQNQAELADRELEELEQLEAAPSETTGDPEDDAKARRVRAEVIDRKREQVMRNHNSVFTNGAKLYKLDAAAPGVNITFNTGGGAQVSAEVLRSNPRALVAEAQRQLLQEHESFTEDMLHQRVHQLRHALTQGSGDVIEGETL